ncbi:response regulator transcription factor [Neobacillus cucumis]|uniref:response regulator n=1 Tax=Neobacillus cucumis TaxID=1740721 RepID=UPI00203BAD3D|nr:response regulator transcription factor [Neobacillus cucumis]MCM3729729.1 response regulator transcription factor [Neobacillus cucumis]
MIRIVIAEDQEMLLEAIGTLLNLEDDMEVIGLAADGEEAIRLVQRLKPDVCLMDIEMPIKSGLEAAEILKPLGSKVIILTTFAREGYWQRALKADVRGYLLKDSPSEVLACSIRSIIAGGRIYSQELMDERFEQEGMETSNDLISQDKPMLGTVKRYLSTIREKMKLPTG